MPPPYESHYRQIAGRIRKGRVIPFLGAGASLCGRPAGATFQPGRFLPDGGELAKELARLSGYPDQTEEDLLRVSQYVDAVLGEGTLYEYLRELFDIDYPPNELHRALAGIARLLRECDVQRQLIITTNYDDLLERAFDEAGEQYDVVTYEAKGGSAVRGMFVHRPYAGPPAEDGTVPERDVVVLNRPNEYADLALDERTVILKLHGAVDRHDADRDSFVATEDSYIEYLMHSDISTQIPTTLLETMADSHFLFLGYAMRDWNLRVILNRILGSRQLDLSSWAIQLGKHGPESAHIEFVEERLWKMRGEVNLFHIDLDSYVKRLEAELFSDEPAGVAA